MNDFDWNLEALASDIQMAEDYLICPHDNIWPESTERFKDLSAIILGEIDEGLKGAFFSCCLASYVITRDSSRLPKDFDVWYQNHASEYNETIGMDLPFHELSEYVWGRFAIALFGQGRGNVVYFVGGVAKNRPYSLTMPEWANRYFGGEAYEAIDNAAKLALRSFHNRSCIIWPMAINRTNLQIDGPSLGLPVNLAIRHLASNLIPPADIIATGALSPDGNPISVDGLDQKMKAANELGFRTFLYPLLGNTNPLQKLGEGSIEPKGVATYQEADEIWCRHDKSNPDNRLRDILKPISFTYEINSLISEFTGRGWLIDEFDSWAADPDGLRFLWLTCGPGMGKSSFAAWICSNRNRLVAAYNFCSDFSKEETCTPVRIIKSLAYQLASKIPLYKERLERVLESEDSYTTAPLLFRKLILEPLTDFPQRECCIVLIDGLDEASSENGEEIESLLTKDASRLPSWLRFIITSRQEPRFKRPSLITTNRIEPDDPRNQEDLARYLECQLAHQNPSPIQIETILKQSEGNFLYLRYVCGEIHEGHLFLNRLDEFPQSLNDVYDRFFKRQFSSIQQYRDQIRPVLRVIAAGYEPLSCELLSQLSGIEDGDVFKDILRALGELFVHRSVSSDPLMEVIRPYHLSLIDWLTSEGAGNYQISRNEGHKALADYGWTQYMAYKNEGLIPSHYVLKWLPQHLASCNRNEAAVTLLQDFGLMMLRAKNGHLDEMLTDYDRSDSRLLKNEQVFFRANSHILRRGSNSWPSYKILLQLAVEYADESSITQAAEKWLEDGNCDWLWLRSSARDIKPQTNCLRTYKQMTGKVSGVIETGCGNLFIWTQEGAIRFTDIEETSVVDLNQLAVIEILSSMIVKEQWYLNNKKNYMLNKSSLCLKEIVEEGDYFVITVGSLLSKETFFGEFEPISLYVKLNIRKQHLEVLSVGIDKPTCPQTVINHVYDYEILTKQRDSFGKVIEVIRLADESFISITDTSAVQRWPHNIFELSVDPYYQIEDRDCMVDSNKLVRIIQSPISNSYFAFNTEELAETQKIPF